VLVATHHDISPDARSVLRQRTPGKGGGVAHVDLRSLDPPGVLRAGQHAGLHDRREQRGVGGPAHAHQGGGVAVAKRQVVRATVDFPADQEAQQRRLVERKVDLLE